MVNTQDYRNAPSGIGPLAPEWEDKPHRLIYDLCREVETLRTALDAVLSPAFVGIIEESEEHPRLSDDDAIVAHSNHLKVELTVGDLRKGIAALRA